MKKLTFFTVALCMLLASCSSDEPLTDSINPSPKGVSVKINVRHNNEFNELKSISPQDGGVKTMLYIVYDEATGNYIKHQKIYTDNTTTINDIFLKGTYRIAIMASTGFLGNIDNENSINIDSYFSEADKNFSSARFQINGSDPENDYFYNDFVLNVESTAVEYSTILNRITAKVEIIPLDATSMPDDIHSVSIAFDWIGQQSFSFKDHSYVNKFELNPEGWGRLWGFVTSGYNKEKLMAVTKDNPISIILFPYESPMSYPVDPEIRPEVYITAQLNKQNETLSRILKRTYKLEPSKILRLTGNLFSNTPSSGTEVSVDNDWEEVQEETFD